MRVAVAGASGFIGKALLGALTRAGHQPVALTRGAAAGAFPPGVTVASVDYADVPGLAKALDGCDGVVNLAGANLFAKRWSKRFKQEILTSRVAATQGLVDAMALLEKRPSVFLSGSAVGHYGPREPGESVDESTARAAEFAPADYLAGVCFEWERAALPAERLGVRTVYLRTGVVLGRGGGAFENLASVFRKFVGGPIAGGKQDVSWVHLDDVCGLILHALADARIVGPFNLTAPNPVSNRELSRALGRALNRPSFLPTPGFGLRLALGGVASMLITGQRVLPAKALATGYVFRFPSLDAALADLTASADAA